MLRKKKISKSFIIACLILLIGITFVLTSYAQEGYRKGYWREKLRSQRQVKQNRPVEKEISQNIKLVMPGGAFPAWSPVINKITFTKKAKDKYEVFIMDPDGTNVKCLTCNKPALKDCGHRGQSYWHPSGKYIVFSAENAKYPRQGLGVPHRPGLGRNFNVWIMTADGGKFQQLTDYPENWGVIETKFSHDGTKIYWNEEYSMEKYPKGKPEDPVPHPGSYWGRENIKYRKGEEICAWRVVYADITFCSDGPKISNIRRINPPDGFTLIEANGFTPDDNGFIYSYANLKETRGMSWWGELYTSGLKGKLLKRLTFTPWKHDEDPVYSPDGKKIIYKEATKGKGIPTDGMELFLMDADGSDGVQLTHFSDPGYPEYREDWLQIAEMDWSPDGKKIIFGNARGNKKALKVNIGSNLYILTIPEKPLKFHSQSKSKTYKVKSIRTIKEYGKSLDWSHNKNLILSAKRGMDRCFDIFVMNPDGANEINLTHNKPGCPQKHNGNPAWHSSGDYIVFTAEKKEAQEKIGQFSLKQFAIPGTGFCCDLWVMTADGKKFYQLTNYPVTRPLKAVIHPQFSHDGKKLFWAERIGGGKSFGGEWALKVADFVIDSRKPHLENIKTYQPAERKCFYESHTFSKDDKKILFCGNLKSEQSPVGLDIYELNLATDQLKRLTVSDSDWDEHAHYSPSGTKIAWMSSTGFDIDWGDIKGHKWQKYLKTELWIMDADGSNKQRLTHFNTHGYSEYMGGARCVVSDSAWSPDGKSIVALLAYETPRGRLRAKIVMVEFEEFEASGNNVKKPAVETYNKSIIHDGLERTYHIYIPPSFDKTKSIPLVIALHGGGGTGKKMEELTLGGFNTLADKEGFIVVYPNGIEKHWNDGRKEVSYRAQRENIDDVSFISALINELVKKYNIDKARVYATGMSNGCMMSHLLAIKLSGKIAAIAPVGATLPKVHSNAKPSRPVPVLMISGTKDPLVPYEGGDIGFGRKKLGKVLSASETVKFWIVRNKCRAKPVVIMEPDKDPKDGTRVRRETYIPEKNGAEVVFCAVEGGGHTWPGGRQYLPEWFIGKTSRDIDANEFIWNFFKKHTIPTKAKVETICTDGIDNDGDGLIDNEDGDCWSREPVFIEDFDPLPTFKDLEAFLPFLKESGIKTIELQGVYEHCTSEHHSYRWQVRDYFKLDPERGTRADLESFLAQAHRLDMKVISFISLEDATPPKFLWRALFIIGFMGYDKDGIGGHFYRYQMKHPEKKILLRNRKGKFACHPYGWGYAVDCSSEDVALEWERILKYILMELGFDGVRVDSPDKNYCHKHEKIYIRCKELSCIDPVEGEYPSLPLYRRLKKILKPDQIFISEVPSTHSAHVKWFCEFPYYTPYPDMDEVAEVSEDYGFTPILLRIVLSGQGPMQKELEKILFKTVARTEEKIGSEDLVKWVNKQYAEHVLHNRERSRFVRNWNYLEIPLFKFISTDPRYFPAVTLLSTIRGVPKVSYYELFSHPKEKNYFPNAINTPELRQLHWKKILNIRNSHNALKYGSISNVWKSGDNTYAYMREYEDEKAIVITNFLDREATSYLDLSFLDKGTVLYDELNDEKFTVIDPNNFQIHVPKYGSRILIINDTE